MDLEKEMIVPFEIVDKSLSNSETPSLIQPFEVIDKKSPNSETPSLIQPFEVIDKKSPSSEVPPMVRPFEVVDRNFLSSEIPLSNKIDERKKDTELEVISLVPCSASQNPAPSADSICTTGSCSDNTQGDHANITAEPLSISTSRLPALRGIVVPANGGIGLVDQSITRFSCDDAGNADVFTHYYGDILRYNCDTGNFHIWDGRVWAADTTLSTEHKAETVMEVYRNTLEKCADGRSKPLQAQYLHARSSCNIGKIRALIEILKIRYSVSQSAFDTHHDLLNVNNGIINLRTGHLMPHDPKYMLTQIITADFNSDINLHSTRFYQFLESVCCEDPELMRYLQVVFGYAITGETKEQLMFLLLGTGSNGKTTFLEAIGNVVGGLLYHLPIGVLIGSNDPRGGGKATPELIPAVASRILVASEANADDFLNEGRVKQLTGESTITLRPLYGSCFELTPRFKIFLDSNYLPRIRGTDFSIWRRLRVIPFSRSFKGAEVDKQLSAILRQPSEQQAILHWLVQGAITYYREGLRDANAVALATKAYRDRNDTLNQFISLHVETDTNSYVIASELFKKYVEFCDSNGITASTQTAFGSSLTALGYEKKRTRNHQVYQGIRLV